MTYLKRFPVVFEGYNGVDLNTLLYDPKEPIAIYLTYTSKTTSEEKLIWEKLIPIVLIHYGIVKLENRYYNDKKLHMRCKHNNVRELLSIGVIRVNLVCIDDNLANP
ncbi:hypothetical protein Lal_00031991 [Lupinus albus]|nr:hypothetical protein Lal_00031991 [Lupinus albus]